MAERQNCWEYMKCGREAGGVRARELSICPAATEKRLHGVHRGKNAGRACWIIAGTICNGDSQGTFFDKYISCTQCDFFELVFQEEGSDFRHHTSLLVQLNGYARSKQ